MKYIDADKLIANLERQNVDKKVIEPVILIIDSLLQEQHGQKKKCNDCPHCVDRKDQYGWHFKGCFGGPYNGKFIAEIDECPLEQEQQENKPNLLKSLEEYFEKTPKEQLDADWEKLKVWNEIGPDVETYCKTQREQQEVNLEKFTEKMDAWKARYNNYPDNIIVKGTMAFTARMFYMYPNIARKWYDGLRKVTQD